MKQQTIPVNSHPNLVIEPVHGDLRVAGWDRLEIMVKTDGDVLKISNESDPITISCDEDLILYAPRLAVVKVEKVSGDVVLQAMRALVSLGPVAGDLLSGRVCGVALDDGAEHLRVVRAPPQALVHAT